jgi:tetratricopeptide (TPR) repeat protein
MRYFIINLLISVFIFSSCTRQSEDSMLNDAKAKLEETKKMEEASKPDEASKLYQEAVNLYAEFLKEYPSSPKAVEVYSTIGRIYSEAKISADKNQDYMNAVRYYKELTEKFPDSKEAKYGMFMIAFIYDEMLKDKELAKESYRKFLEKYPMDTDPNEKMSESARMMLQMLEENRSIEDIIKNPKGDTTKPKQDTVKTKAPTQVPGEVPGDDGVKKTEKPKTSSEDATQ